jgi:hypothetical protein
VAYEPWPGQLNNMRLSFETVLVLARLLDRALVIPEWRYRRLDEPDDRSLNPRELFELSALRRDGWLLFPDDPEYPRDGQQVTPESDDVLYLDVQSGEAILCFPARPPAQSAAASRLRQFAAGRRVFGELPPGHEEIRWILVPRLLEPFYTFFFLDADRERSSKQWIRDRLHFRAEIRDIADRALGALSDYYAVHVRRGDFILDRPYCHLPCVQILKTLQKHVPQGATLYVATDETDREFFRPLREQYRLCFFADVAPPEAAAAPKEWLACAEQLLCARARSFIGTRLSTFSTYIQRLRGYTGTVDTSLHFTDGWQEPASSQALYSWFTTRKAGIPLWGMEYREAWELDSPSDDGRASLPHAPTSSVLAPDAAP